MYWQSDPLINIFSCWKERMSTFIGKGGYGKVYRPPPITCSATMRLKPPKTNYIGKVANTATSPEEKIKSVQKERRQIDKQGLFTTPYLGACRRKPENMSAKQWQNGRFNIEYIYPYGGKPLSDMPIKTVNDKWKLFCCMFKLAYQVGKMNRKGYYHFDIKADNVLFQEEGCRLVLIDFDLSMPKERVLEVFSKEKGFANVVYFVWPPEINLGLNPKKQPPIRLSTIPAGLQFMVEQKYFTAKELLDHLNRFLMSKDYADIWKTKEADITKTDLFSIGMLMKFFLYGFNKDVDALIRSAIEPVPSQRTTWAKFLKEYKTIILKYFS